MGTLVVALILLVIISLICTSLIRSKKRGKHACCGDCAGCAGCCHAKRTP